MSKSILQTGYGYSGYQFNYDFRNAYAHDGYATLRGVVHPGLVAAAKRLLNLEIVNWGLSADQVKEWHEQKSWFPTLREYSEITNLISPFEPEMESFFGSIERCEPQILCHYPDEAPDWPVEWHQDQEPDWAEDRKYRVIAGVALSDNNIQNGGLVVRVPYAGDNHLGDAVEMRAGDVVFFHPDVWHRGGLNRTGDVRMMVYFRYLEGK